MMMCRKKVVNNLLNLTEPDMPAPRDSWRQSTGLGTD